MRLQMAAVLSVPTPALGLILSEGWKGVYRVRTKDNLEVSLGKQTELELDACGIWINRKGIPLKNVLPLSPLSTLLRDSVKQALLSVKMYVEDFGNQLEKFVQCHSVFKYLPLTSLSFPETYLPLIFWVPSVHKAFAFSQQPPDVSGTDVVPIAFQMGAEVGKG